MHFYKDGPVHNPLWNFWFQRHRVHSKTGWTPPHHQTLKEEGPHFTHGIALDGQCCLTRAWPWWSPADRNSLLASGREPPAGSKPVWGWHFFPGYQGESGRNETEVSTVNIFDNNNTRKRTTKLTFTWLLIVRMYFFNLIFPVLGTRWLKTGLFLLPRRSSVRQNSKHQYHYWTCQPKSVFMGHWKQEGRGIQHLSHHCGM